MNAPAEPAKNRRRREDDASGEIDATRVSRGAALVLILTFLAVTGTIAVLNLLHLHDQWGGLIKATTSSPAATREGSRGWWDQVMTWDTSVMTAIKKVETAYDEESAHCKATQPVVQKLLAALGHGGDDVLLGEDGWLIHRNAIRFLTRPWPAEKRAGATASMAESIRAIEAFAAYLKQRDTALVLMPVPPKVSIQPDKYGRSLKTETIMPSNYEDWLRQARAAGAHVFDVRPVLSEARDAGTLVFLKTDTHWTAPAMEKAVAEMAKYLAQEGLVTTPATPPPPLAAMEVTNFGDLRRMLRVDENSPLFPSETTTTHPVPPASAPGESPVLVMGDSFCNIFSQESLGWGTHAGFADQLGHLLGQPVDTILRNGDGAFATRRILSQALQKGTDRLAGKKVVIWEFDATQLMVGTWENYSYSPAATTPQAGEARFLGIEAGQSGTFTGTVVSVSTVPTPGTVAYRDYVATLHLTRVTRADGSPAEGTEMLLYGLAMKDNEWTALAKIHPGDSVEVTAKCWADVEDAFGPLNRGEPEGDLFLQPVNWLDSLKPSPGAPR